MRKTRSQHEESGLAPERVLAAVPIRNQAVAAEKKNHHLTLWVPVRKRWWMRPPLTWLMQFRRRRGIELDQLGQKVWEACNGEKSVEDIVSEFARDHNLQFHEARIAVSKFLQKLMERNLIAMAIPHQ